jgi:hypothetical protein
MGKHGPAIALTEERLDGLAETRLFIGRWRRHVFLLLGFDSNARSLWPLAVTGSAQAIGVLLELYGVVAGAAGGGANVERP